MPYKRGITLLEIVFALSLIFFLVSSICLVYLAVLRGEDHLGQRTELHEKLHFALERIVRDVREATAMSVANHGLRFSLRESGSTDGYIYYLYHASDSWVPAYNQSTYELRRAGLTESGTPNDLSDDTFTYGAGDLIVADLKPPAADTSMTSSGNNAIIRLVGAEEDETMTVRGNVRPRNV